MSGARIELPENLAEAGLTNVLTGEVVSTEEREGAFFVPSERLFGGFPVALLASP